MLVRQRHTDPDHQLSSLVGPEQTRVDGRHRGLLSISSERRDNPRRNVLEDLPHIRHERKLVDAEE
jgi:hypothetical protein